MNFKVLNLSKNQSFAFLFMAITLFVNFSHGAVACLTLSNSGFFNSAPKDEQIAAVINEKCDTKLPFTVTQIVAGTSQVVLAPSGFKVCCNQK